MHHLDMGTDDNLQAPNAKMLCFHLRKASHKLSSTVRTQKPEGGRKRSSVGVDRAAPPSRSLPLSACLGKSK